MCYDTTVCTHSRHKQVYSTQAVNTCAKIYIHSSLELPKNYNLHKEIIIQSI